MNSNRDLIYDHMALGLCVALLAVVGASFQVPGLAWDDHYQSRYGDLILIALESGFADQRVLDYANLRYYGGLFDAPAQWLARQLPFLVHDTRHLLSALAGVVGLIGAWRFARYVGGTRAGLLAVVLLVATPTYVGHMYINVKDIPFAAGYIWSLYLATRAVIALPKVPVPLMLGLGIALGSTLGVRIGGVLVVGYMGLLLIQHYLWVRGRSPLSGLVSEVSNVAGAILVMLVPAFILTFALWPAAWANPLLAAMLGLMETARFRFEIDVLLGGVLYTSSDLPAHYMLTYFALKLPEILLVGLVVALPVVLGGWWTALKSGERIWGFGIPALLLGAFFPVAYSLAMHSVHYDAIRHFIFVLPVLAIITALGLAKLWGWAERQNAKLVWLGAGVLGFGVVVSVVRMTTLFPYTYVSYNVFAGGVQGAARQYEMDYWALSYKEAAHKLSVFLITDPAPYTVYVCGPQPSLKPFLDPRAKIVDDINAADFFVAFTRWDCDQSIKAPVVAEVLAAGTRLSVVKDLRQGFDIVGEGPKTSSLEPKTE